MVTLFTLKFCLNCRRSRFKILTMSYTKKISKLMNCRKDCHKATGWFKRITRLLKTMNKRILISSKWIVSILPNPISYKNKGRFQEDIKFRSKLSLYNCRDVSKFNHLCTWSSNRLKNQDKNKTKILRA